MHLDLRHKKIEYDFLPGISISGNLIKKDIEIDIGNFITTLDFSNNEVDVSFDYEIILREPLPNKHAVYIFFERIFCFLCGCGFCANSQN
jgi:hypothetical protein